MSPWICAKCGELFYHAPAMHYDGHVWCAWDHVPDEVIRERFANEEVNQ